MSRQKSLARAKALVARTKKRHAPQAPEAAMVSGGLTELIQLFSSLDSWRKGCQPGQIMLRGTRVLRGTEACRYTALIQEMREYLHPA